MDYIVAVIRDYSTPGLIIIRGMAIKAVSVPNFKGKGYP